MDTDTLNLIHKEESQYYKWVNEEKNRILRMTNTERKQKEWSLLFPKMVHDDSYLMGNVF